MPFVLTSPHSIFVPNFKVTTLLFHLTHFRNRTLAIFLLIFCSLTTKSYALNETETDNRQAKLSKAAAFTLVDTNDKTHQLSDYKGSVLVVNFWASWCAPCREEIPAMNNAAKQLSNDNVVFLAINYGETLETVNQFLTEHPIDFTVLLDSDNIASSDWGVTVMPTTVIINQQLEVIDTVLGPREWDSQSMIEKILSIK